VLRVAKCRLLKGGFVPKMSEINSRKNVNLGSIVGNMVISPRDNICGYYQPETKVSETCSVPVIRMDADGPNNGVKTKLAHIEF
jgi:hypothetical protein